MYPTFVDSHAHLSAEEFTEDREPVIKRAFQGGVSTILCPADMTDEQNIQITLRLTEKYPHIFAAAGVHPHNAKDFLPSMDKSLIQLAEDRKINAIGEIGLDFHYNFSPKKDQIAGFRHQLNIAQELNLPVVVHSRKAAKDIEEAVEEEGFTKGGVLHCFTEDWEFAKRMLNHKFWVSFSGILTYPNAQSLREIAKRLPLDKVLIETDSPYLLPVPYRGKFKRNEPLYVKEVAKTLAQVKQVPLEDIAYTTSQNFRNLLNV